MAPKSAPPFNLMACLADAPAPRFHATLRRLAEDFWVLVDEVEAERKAHAKAERAARRRAGSATVAAPPNE